MLSQGWKPSELGSRNLGTRAGGGGEECGEPPWLPSLSLCVSAVQAGGGTGVTAAGPDLGCRRRETTGSALTYSLFLNFSQITTSDSSKSI